MHYNTTHHISLIHTVETISTGYTLIILDLIFFISIILAIFVIISKNPIVSVLFLIGLFFNIACYLILLGINFVGLSYLLVYVGAVSILFLFILMLINVRISELTTENTNSIPLVLIISIPFIYPFQKILNINTIDIYNIFSNTTEQVLYNYYNNIHSNTFYKINDYFFVTSKIWDGYISETTHITSIGNIMYTNYSIWLLITSIVLLLAMIGSIVITLKKD